MSCPTSIETTRQILSRRFFNWARKIDFTANTSYQPSSRGEIVSIIRQAESENRRVKWTGSLWSFTESFVSNDYIIESHNIRGEISSDLILNRLPLTDPIENLIHIKGGTKIYNLNRILHGLLPATNGGGADEADLDCGVAGLRNKAMPTLGGSGGQSIAGLLATGSHGGDLNLTPMADAVRAIHLIGPNGQEWWIERSSDGLTTGTESAVQENLRTVASTVTGALEEICDDVIVKKDDDFFNSVLVSVGRMGFIYSLVIRTAESFKLAENRRNDTWETLKRNLTATSFNDYINDRSDAIGFNLHFLQILINPFRNTVGHECKVAERHVVPCTARNQNMEADESFDPMGFICKQQDIRSILPILIGILALLLATIAGLIALASALIGIPFIGWILAAALYVAAAALTVTSVALTGLIVFISVSGGLTSGELIAAIANFAYSTGMKDLMSSLLGFLFNTAYPIESKIGVSWKIMDTYGYIGEDFCQKVESMEFGFDISASSIDGRGIHTGYLGFLEQVFVIFDDLFGRNNAVAGLMAIRYTRNTNAKIGMSKFERTCHIEIPIIQEFGGNAEFIERVQRAAIAFGGVPHWGQLMNHYNSGHIRTLFDSDLTIWRETLTELIRIGGGNDFTFSNNFTLRYNLEPLTAALIRIKQLNIQIEVGEDGIRGQDAAGTSHLLGDLHYTLEGIDTMEVIEFNNIGTRVSPNWRGWGTGIHTITYTFSEPVLILDINRLVMYMPAAGGPFGDNADINQVIVRAVSLDDSDCQIGSIDLPFRFTGNNERMEITFSGCI